MPLRVAIGELSHETNTFCAGLTTSEDFRRFMWFEGEAIRDAHAGNRTYLGGMLDRCGQLGLIGVPTFAAVAYPSGTIAASAFRELLDRLLAGIRAALPVDAVALSLHGAGVAEGHDDLRPGAHEGPQQACRGGRAAPGRDRLHDLPWISDDRRSRRRRVCPRDR